MNEQEILAYLEQDRTLRIDMIESIRLGRKGRVSGEMSLHALEIMLSFERAAGEKRRIELETTCERPIPMTPVSEDGKLE